MSRRQGNCFISGVNIVDELDHHTAHASPIAAAAVLTARNVTVRIYALANSSNAVTFTVVNPPAPALTTVAPNSGVRGTAVSRDSDRDEFHVDWNDRDRVWGEGHRLTLP